MLWIKHDTNANQDAKLKRVRMKYGLEGYGLYWYCIELIAADIDQNNLTFELEHDAEIIAFDTGIHVERVNEMMAYMVNLGLFESSDKAITCLKILKRLDQSMTSNKKMREMITKAKDDHDKVMTKSNAVMIKPDKVMQEEKRREENKDIYQIQAALDAYHSVIDQHKPNWSKVQTFDYQRKRLVKKALTTIKPRAQAVEIPELEYFTNLMEAMAVDSFFSGLPNNKNPDGYRCAIETNLKPTRIKQAIDQFAGE